MFFFYMVADSVPYESCPPNPAVERNPSVAEDLIKMGTYLLMMKLKFMVTWNEQVFNL